MIKKYFLSFLLGLFLLAPVGAPALAQFGGLSDSEVNLGTVATEASLTADRTLPQVIGGFIRVALSFLGLIFLILVIYAGFLWMTAGGNDDQVGKAKTLVGQAVVGLIIVISAYAISTFVIDAISSATGNTAL
jgi:hypothetical protein